MNRSIGTVVRGIRTPIFNQGDNLAEIIPDLLMDVAKQNHFEFRDKDVLAMTESIVARTQGNYANTQDIKHDLQKKLNGEKVLGVTFPILSRNRFSVLLKGIASAVDKVVLQLSYPSDEVGNHLFPSDLLVGAKVNPWNDILLEDEFLTLFGEHKHPFTGMNYIQYYREIIENEGAECVIIFANDVSKILNYTSSVLTCDIHTRHQSKRILKNNGAQLVLGLDDLLNQESDTHGFNELYGLLGSNKADEDRVKLFPRNSQPLVDKIAQTLFEKTGKQIEVMIYGDGAFKDPVGRIWELADPVVSPAYTSGLEGTPNELKLKYLADTEFKNMDHQQQQELLTQKIRDKKDFNATQALGTTPRQITDLLGSLADLTSGSGDKGTPIVYIQGYFDNFADED